MSKVKEQLLGICACLAEALVGILLLINPLAFTTGIIIAAGIVLLVIGIVSIIKYFAAAPVEAAKRQLLFKGLLVVVSGGFLILRSDWLLVAFPMLGILYGLGVFLAGLGKVQWAIDRLRLKESRWFLGAIGAAISIVCGIVIMVNPFTSASVLWIFAGVSLIAEAVCDLIAVFYKKRSSESQCTAEAAEADE